MTAFRTGFTCLAIVHVIRHAGACHRHPLAVWLVRVVEDGEEQGEATATSLPFNPLRGEWTPATSAGVTLFFGR
jgi:hypothetical protein